ncbi:MAG: 50S ribosomal protein L11 [Candidatus Altiarchaeota archaeon]
MAKKETIEVLVEGGKANAGPPLGPALGPTGINVADVISKINEKTADYSGMKVPVKVVIDASEKTFEIEIGSPPTSALIKKELGIEKGTGDGKPVGDLTYDQLVKITNMKSDQLLGADQVAKMKEIIGSCQSIGITIEGRTAKHAFEALERGELDKEMSEEEKAAQLEEERLKDEAAAQIAEAEEAAAVKAPEPAEGEAAPAEEAKEGAEEKEGKDKPATVTKGEDRKEGKKEEKKSK